MTREEVQLHVVFTYLSCVFAILLPPQHQHHQPALELQLCSSLLLATTWLWAPWLTLGSLLAVAALLKHGCAFLPLDRALYVVWFVS